MKTPREPRVASNPRPRGSWKAWWTQAKTAVTTFFQKVLPRAGDDESTRLFKTFGWSLVGMVFFVSFFAAAVFFLALRGEEETMVPQVVGLELSSALLALQEKELVPFIQVKFSEDPQDKGNVIDQDPKGGLLSRAGRRVTLSVSRGAIVDKVENFVGQNVNDVQLRLRTLFATQAVPLLALAEQPIYQFNSAPEGTVLEQKPAPGTPLASPTTLEVVVSKGPKGQTVTAGTYTGRQWSEALAALIGEARPFLVALRPAEAGERPGYVVAQAPAPGQTMPRLDPVTLTVAPPNPPSDGRFFVLLDTELPEYPILVDVKITLRKASGDSAVLYQLKHPGGRLTVPFVAGVGDVVSVAVLEKEVHTAQVSDLGTLVDAL